MSSPKETTIDSESELLNSYNLMDHRIPKTSDVVVVGGGIHSLIYAIHLKKKELQNQSQKSVTILERNQSPGYKIGESTLTVFGLWLKLIGIDTPMLARLFGPKDGLVFYYFSALGDPEDYTAFIANGPPADFVPTLQIKRKVSELMLTLFAQRLGISVLHGKEVMVDTATLAPQDCGITLQVKDSETK
ncbi:FAD/NAD(P)-binding protein [Glarea lozoyensis ATCC 20868]|uniref:FAD/NAD(P)-binding protein n=1 Tax=Glarea lozoyensis (strain ATCC 20868 / MF5171) TaxID=1116229 RepID=S3DX09_GLAL2|nr:FAD/NAD(P)-binding protein [Glarea lozoyensis ATCC 20868]EPE30913.1 FAD/NAD(P)-binding protein [Glarea lozoyensis ATCC 20868]